MRRNSPEAQLQAMVDSKIIGMQRVLLDRARKVPGEIQVMSYTSSSLFRPRWTLEMRLVCEPEEESK